MTALYLFGLFVLLLTEYGFQSRDQALDRFESHRWRRVALRLLLWAAFTLLILRVGRVGLAAIATGVAAALLTELAATLHRRWLRSSFASGSPHGSVQAQFSPLVLSLLVPLSGLIAAGAAAGRGPGGVLIAMPARWLAMASSFVALWCWATFVTVAVIELVRPEELREEGEASGWGPGEVIGILERLIAFVLILAGSPAAVGLVLAAKSAARFPEFKKASFAEYFLVGTLISLGLAVSLGVIVSGLRSGPAAGLPG